MGLRAIELIHVVVPLRKAIKHASHERTTSDNLVVKATLGTGEVGYGEGVPRSYVTGETIASTFEALAKYDAFAAMGDPTDYDEAVRRVAALALPETAADPRGMAANAARCALEIALLDAYGRRFGTSISEAIRLLAPDPTALRPSPTEVRYSGAITAESPRKERISALKMRAYGFRQVKVKVGVPGQDDPARLRRIRRLLGRRMDIRIDANEAWHPDELAEKVAPLLPSRPTALEQPVPHEEVGALAALRESLGVPIMLDESLCGVPDAERAVREGLADILNVRLSKCGGFGPSLRIADLARRAGLGVQLGCHPGETGLLSAAGRHFAGIVPNLRYVEGSYDRHVLGDNLIVGDVTFRYGGRAAPPDRTRLGGRRRPGGARPTGGGSQGGPP